MSPECHSDFSALLRSPPAPNYTLFTFGCLFLPGFSVTSLPYLDLPSLHYYECYGFERAFFPPPR